MAPSGSATAARLSQVAALAGRVGRAARAARVISRVRMLGNDSRRGLGLGARARLGRYPHFLGSFGNFHGLLCGFVLLCLLKFDTTPPPPNSPNPPHKKAQNRTATHENYRTTPKNVGIALASSP